MARFGKMWQDEHVENETDVSADDQLPSPSLVCGVESSTSCTLISSSSLEEEDEEALLASARIRSSSLDSLSGGGVT